MSYECNKNAHLLRQFMSIFKSRKVWNFLIKIQLKKSDPKGQGVKVTSLQGLDAN
jgi:hypothetical protein